MARRFHACLWVHGCVGVGSNHVLFRLITILIVGICPGNPVYISVIKISYEAFVTIFLPRDATKKFMSIPLFCSDILVGIGLL